MKFGSVPVDDALGAILAHSLDADGAKFRKGRVLSQDDIDALAEVFDKITVARLEPGDVHENEAAKRLADALKGHNLGVAEAFTGRANLVAETAGVIRINADVAALNGIDEGITLATLPDYMRVSKGQMVATIKIIPYGVPGDLLKTALAANTKTLDLHPFKRTSASLILTETPAMKKSLSQKAETVLRKRLLDLQIDKVDVTLVAHETEAVKSAIEQVPGDMILILGGSATSDRLDVCPAALIAAGGTLHRFGMPVDPGNLLFIGARGGAPVIGLPGCVRSPALNGADWVLERIAAGLDVRSEDIAAMGVGGLLKEIPTRPQPRMRK